MKAASKWLPKKSYDSTCSFDYLCIHLPAKQYSFSRKPCGFWWTDAWASWCHIAPSIAVNVWCFPPKPRHARIWQIAWPIILAAAEQFEKTTSVLLERRCKAHDICRFKIAFLPPYLWIPTVEWVLKSLWTAGDQICSISEKPPNFSSSDPFMAHEIEPFDRMRSCSGEFSEKEIC